MFKDESRNSRFVKPYSKLLSQKDGIVSDDLPDESSEGLNQCRWRSLNKYGHIAAA